MSVKGRVVQRPGGARRYAPSDPLSNVGVSPPPIAVSKTTPVGSLFNSSVPLPLNAVLQVGADERAKVAQAKEPMANKPRPTPSENVNAALEDLVTNFERSRMADPSLSSATDFKSKPFAKPDLSASPGAPVQASAPTPTPMPTLQESVRSAPPLARVDGVRGQERSTKSSTSMFKNAAIGRRPDETDYWSPGMSDPYEEGYESRSYDNKAPAGGVRYDEKGTEMMDLGKHPPTTGTADEAGDAYRVIEEELHNSVSPELTAATSLANRAAAHADVESHADKLLLKHAHILDDTDHKHSATDEVARRAFNDAVGDGEGDKQEQLTDHVSHKIQSVAEEISTSDMHTAKANADRCRALCAAAGQTMHQQCASHGGYDRKEVDFDKFTKDMMNTISQLFARPDHSAGHVSKELYDNVQQVFLSLAKLIVGMSTHEARDVVALTAHEMNKHVHNAEDKAASGGKESYFKTVMHKSNEFVANSCAKLRKWMSFGKHDGTKHGSPAYVSSLSKLAGGARTFGNGIKNATRNQLSKIREGIDTAKDSMAKRAANAGISRLAVTNKEQTRQWLEKHLKSLQ